MKSFLEARAARLRMRIIVCNVGFWGILTTSCSAASVVSGPWAGIVAVGTIIMAGALWYIEGQYDKVLTEVEGQLKELDDAFMATIKGVCRNYDMVLKSLVDQSKEKP